MSVRPQQEVAGPAPPRSTLGEAMRALRHRNFRLFTAGQTLSLVGTWMQQVAIGWLIYRLTESAFLLGFVGFVSQAPVFVLAPFAGVVADRFSRHRIILVTQTLAMTQALVLAALVLGGGITVWQIVLLMALLGAITGFDIPARQSFLLEMVGSRDDLPNAIALNSSVFNAARLIGPAIAGFAINWLGEGPVILLNGVSYIAVLAALLAMRVPPRSRVTQPSAVFRHMREGFGYAFDSRPIRTILVFVAATSIAGVPFSVLLPIIATDVLGGGARTLGFLMAATGLGALAGALFLASRRSVRGLGRVIAISATLFGGSLIFVGFSRVLWISLPLLACAGFGMMVQMAASNTILQTIVDDDKRGRIMSLYSMAHIGTAPLGALLAGIVASRIGAPAALALGGGITVLGAVIFRARLPRLREFVRPIYVRLGIMPEMVGGIQAATQLTTPAPMRNGIQSPLDAKESPPPQETA